MFLIFCWRASELPRAARYIGICEEKEKIEKGKETGDLLKIETQKGRKTGRSSVTRKFRSGTICLE